MLTRSRLRLAPLRILLAAIVVCFGIASIVGTGGGGGGNGGAAGPVSVEGVWLGSQTETVYLCIIFICTPDHEVSSKAMALASKSGKIHLLPWDAVNSTAAGRLVTHQFAGTVKVSGSAVSGTIRGTCDPLDGPPILGHIEVEGSVGAGVSLDLDYDLDECIGRGTFNLDFIKAAANKASPAKVKGQWSSGSIVLTVDEDGAFTGATDSGCQLSGSILPASTQVNVYDARVRVDNCGFIDGAYSGLAGIAPDRSGINTLVISALGTKRTISIVVKR